MKIVSGKMARLLPLVVCLAFSACHGGTDDGTDGGLDAADEDGSSTTDKQFADMGPGDCQALSSVHAIEIRRGESIFCRNLSDYDTVEFSVDPYTGTGIHLHELIDLEIADHPEDWRYQAYGTDGYTFGGYASWENLLHGYLELTTRRVIFEASQELDHSFFVKDTYLIVLTPAGI